MGWVWVSFFYICTAFSSRVVCQTRQDLLLCYNKTDYYVVAGQDYYVMTGQNCCVVTKLLCCDEIRLQHNQKIDTINCHGVNCGNTGCRIVVA